jgi:hypothetical protein
LLAENLQQVYDVLCFSNQSVFLTGKAGTGKTTFLHYLKTHLRKKLVVLAPTGVAAINAGGVTLHSFFQLPFVPFIPQASSGFGMGNSTQNINSLLANLRLSQNRKSLIQELELIIIDEISMVRADVLDAIDTVLKHVRQQPLLPFGGVQLLFIGDLFQLAPVVTQQEKDILAQFYNSPYFFSSRIIEAAPPVYVALDKVYRQSSEQFIRVLNQIRNNTLNQEGWELLHERYIGDFEPKQSEGYITLTSHNAQADVINKTELEKLKTPTFSYEAIINDDFPERNYPAELHLQLKVGAMVMFIKNDSGEDRAFYNGKIGVVTDINEEGVFVLGKEDIQPIKVAKETWRYTQYELNYINQEIIEKELGSFTQYPLRLAWAITIHKSQGLSFDKLIIDAAKAFAPGQVYVALSRGRSLEGLVLKTPLNPRSIYNEQVVVAYTLQQETATLNPEIVKVILEDYAKQALANVYEFEPCNVIVIQLAKFIKEQAILKPLASWCDEFMVSIEPLIKVGNVFKEYLISLNTKATPLEEIPVLQDKIKNSVGYCQPLIAKALGSLWPLPIAIDNQQIALQITKYVKELYFILHLKQYAFHGFANGFEVKKHMAFIQQYKKPMGLPSTGTNAAAAVGKHPELYKQLRQWRDAEAGTGTPVYMVANAATLLQIADLLPNSKEALCSIKGFGEKKYHQYGAAIISMVNQYCQQQGIEATAMLPNRVVKKQKSEAKAAAKNEAATTAKKEPKAIGDNKEDLKLPSPEITFTMFTNGKTIEEIALERNLAKTTIEGHLALKVGNGQLPITQMVAPEKIEAIQKVLLQHTNEDALTPIKEILGDSYSFNEIRMVKSFMRYVADLAANDRESETQEDL